MEFTITCPVDGPITVSLEDIDTVILRESEHADITFVCPHCGAEITMSAVVPSFLLAAIEALAEEGDAGSGAFTGVVEVVMGEDASADGVVEIVDDPVADAYCEYFRRQLAEIDSVEDALTEIDAGK